MPREISHRGRAWQKGRLSRRRAGKGGGGLGSRRQPPVHIGASPERRPGEWAGRVGPGSEKVLDRQGSPPPPSRHWSPGHPSRPLPRRRHSPLCAFWGGAVTESLNFAGGGTLDGGGAGFEALESPPESQLTVHCTLQTCVPNHMQHT